MIIDENIIVRVARMQTYEVDLEDIRAMLLGLGFNEYDIFLVYKAGETFNVISQREYKEHT